MQLPLDDGCVLIFYAIVLAAVPSDHKSLTEMALWCRNGGGWGGGRGNSLAELGITEEEFEEYAQRKPRRDKDGDNPEAGTLAMGMDVDLSQAPKQAAKSRTDTAHTVFIFTCPLYSSRVDILSELRCPRHSQSAAALLQCFQAGELSSVYAAVNGSRRPPHFSMS